MNDPVWETADRDANRLRQHGEFLALPFREKVRRIEQLAEVAAMMRGAVERVRSNPLDATSDDRGTPDA
jgi:hypothetical protein